jgi:hypothetical protein
MVLMAAVVAAMCFEGVTGAVFGSVVPVGVARPFRVSTCVSSDTSIPEGAFAPVRRDSSDVHFTHSICLRYIKCWK